ncbi:MAG: hypothetical protein Q9170_005385 [Blastenia crenularia]
MSDEAPPKELMKRLRYNDGPEVNDIQANKPSSLGNANLAIGTPKGSDGSTPKVSDDGTSKANGSGTPKASDNDPSNPESSTNEKLFDDAETIFTKKSLKLLPEQSTIDMENAHEKLLITLVFRHEQPSSLIMDTNLATGIGAQTSLRSAMIQKSCYRQWLNPSGQGFLAVDKGKGFWKISYVGFLRQQLATTNNTVVTSPMANPALGLGSILSLLAHIPNATPSPPPEEAAPDGRCRALKLDGKSYTGRRCSRRKVVDYIKPYALKTREDLVADE